LSKNNVFYSDYKGYVFVTGHVPLSSGNFKALVHQGICKVKTAFKCSPVYYIGIDSQEVLTEMV